MRQRLIQLAIHEPALSPRELAVRFTDSQSDFVSEASVYRLLKAHDLIASPAFIDGPEILSSSTQPICLIGADAGQLGLNGPSELLTPT